MSAHARRTYEAICRLAATWAFTPGFGLDAHFGLVRDDGAVERLRGGAFRSQPSPEVAWPGQAPERDSKLMLGAGPKLGADPDRRVVIHPLRPGAVPRSLSAVTGEIFYSPDLNKIAATIRANQQANITDPATPSQQLFVDDDGNIVFGDQVDGSSGRQLSKVTQETFYTSDRHAQEVAIVGKRLPGNTVFATDGEVGGWLYRIVNDLGDTYDLFLWYEVASGTYKVSLVEPRLGGAVGVHDCHLFPDGTLCLKEHGGSGYRNLADAYARSVIWTLGASCYRRGYGFQFNVDQVS